MADSPSKRRKTSPTTSFPVPPDAPATPSRIPVLRRPESAKALSGRPSFASPTRASIARHNPHLLNRPSSSGPGSDRRRSRVNVQDIFARALGEAPPVVEGQAAFLFDRGDGSRSQSTTQENESGTERAITPGRSTRLIGGGLAAKPRRMSKSPRKTIERPIVEAGFDLEGISNPFQKKGLRRSPVHSQPETVTTSEKPLINDPFKKKGLRRSPIPSQPLEAIPLSPLETRPQTKLPQAKLPEGPLEFSTTPPGPPPAQALQPAPVILNRKEVREEPVPVKIPMVVLEPPAPAVSQQTEPIEIERFPKIKSPEKPTATSYESSQQPPKSKSPKQPRVSQVEEVIHTERGQREEPELPPTPTQRGLLDPIVTTPPTGIHDTPSKRARRNKALAAKIKSSPLKPRDPAPEEPSKPIELILKVSKQPSERRKSARFLIPEDPHASKKNVRDDLLRQLEQLQADLVVGDQENKRLRSRQTSKKNAPSVPKEPDALAAMLARATAPESESLPESKPASLFKSIGSFLPFRSRRKYDSIPSAISEAPVRSHLPIEPQDPLPYLQAFSSLTYTSTISLLPTENTENSSEESSQPIFQQHLINASHPSGLFASRISMIVNTSNFTISSLEIAKLDPSSEAELGTFVRGRASAGVLGKDISVICWAMGRWTEVALSRAKFWCAIENDFRTPDSRAISLQKARSRTKKRKRQGSTIEGVEDDPDPEPAVKWTRKQLMPHMGRTNMYISNTDVEILFEWNITFDWTGEAESEISASAKLPGNWRKGDERNSLSKIPEAFKKMVKELGPIGAVRSIVGLLMSEE